MSSQDIYTREINRESALRALKFIFAGSQDGLVEFRYLNAKTSKIAAPSDYLPLPLMDEVINFNLFAQKENQLFTFGPAARYRTAAKPRKSGSDSDIEEIRCLWVNLDFDKAPAGGGVIEVIRRIHNLPLRPSIVVNSGDARQVYYVLKTPLRGTGLLDWQQMNDSLRYALGCSGTQQAPGQSSGVMALPGTFNYKYDGTLIIHKICDDQSGWLRYSLEEVKEFLKVAGETYRNEVESRSSRGNDSKSSLDPGNLNSSAQIYQPTIADLKERRVPLRVIESIFYGRGIPNSDFRPPSAGDADLERDLWVSGILLELNFSPEEIKGIFRSNPTGCGSKWVRPKQGEAYLETILKRAAARGGEQRGLKEKNNESFTIDSVPPGYELRDDNSVWQITAPVREDREPKTTLVSNSPLRLSEIRENVDTGQISVVISYEYLGRSRSTVMLRSQMCDPRSLVTILSGEGAPITSNNSRLMVSYLAAYEHAFSGVIPRKQVTSRFGRGGGGGRRGAAPASAGAPAKFFLPGLASAVEFAPNGAGDAALYQAYSARAGTLGEWVEVVNRLGQDGFMIPQAAVLASFVPPLQKILQIPNFIVDIFGNTSSGKSTTLKLAASVYGRPFDPDSLILQWMNTKLAVEQIAGMCSELPIYLDDAQHCPDELKRTVIYMIANGKGKARSAGGARGGIRETMSWQTVALSTSEEPLFQSSPHEGVRGRLLPLGGSETPFPAHSGSVVQSLEKAVAACHGFAGETFIRHLNGWKWADWARWQKRYAMLRSELARDSASGVAGRVSGYIAAIGVAGEIACPLLGLNFKPDVLVAWLASHVREQESNQNMVLIALRSLAEHYLSNPGLFSGTEQFGNSRTTALQGVAKKGQYVGFTRKALETVFARRKWNQTMLLEKMSEAGVLVATESDRHTKKVRVEGANHRLVCVKWSALLPDDAD